MNLTSLTLLEASNNTLHSLPAKIGNMRSLEELHCQVKYAFHSSTLIPKPYKPEPLSPAKPKSLSSTL